MQQGTRHRTIRYALLTMAAVMLAACTDGDTYEAVLYGDTAISSFTLGTLNKYIDGEKTTYAGSSYAMEINSATHVIENSDLLPYGTDVEHVVCTIYTMNNGVLALQHLDDEYFSLYVASDSIDFTTPRTFRIYPSNGQGYTDYTVRLNVEPADGNAYTWQLMDGVTPPTEVLPTGIKQLLGKSSYEAYALSDAGKLMVKKDQATEWTQDIADTDPDAAHLPTSDVALVSYPMALSDSTDYVLMAGTVGGTTAVWRKIVDNHDDHGVKGKGEWIYMDRGDETAGLLPPMANLQLISYDGKVFALGGDYKTIYRTRDNGITWHTTDLLTLPDDFDYTATKVSAATDDDNYLWLYCHYADGTTKTWRGRLNRLGW